MIVDTIAPDWLNAAARHISAYQVISSITGDSKPECWRLPSRRARW